MNFKRIISFMVAVVMIVTMVPATFAAVDSFVDFPDGWSREAMAFSVENDLLRGTGDNKIEPAANLTRAEMATIINRAFNAKIAKDISAFSDVKSTDWYYQEMAKAVNMQTFRGDDKGLLRPKDAITREEVMAVIARAMVLEQSDYSPIDRFNDSADVSSWAKPYVAALVAGGYVNGNESGNLNPKNNITREEFAQLMYNIFKTYLKAAGTYNTVTSKNCVMINEAGITLSDVVIDGDLVIGDGVGSDKVYINNVTINGRLLARAGNITLTNVTTGKGVVVNNVNGTTHFNNYKSEPVFDGVAENTYTTYKSSNVVTGGGSSGGGGGSGSTVSKKFDYTINYYYQNVDDIRNGIITYNLLETIPVTGVKKNTKVTLEPKSDKNGYTYVFNADKSSVNSDSAEIVITSDIAIHIYYDLQAVKVVAPDGSSDVVVVTDSKTVRNVVAETGLGETQTTIDGNTYGIRWYVVKDGETKGDNWVDTEAEWTSVVPDGYHVEYELYANVTLKYNDGVTADNAFEVLVGADGTYKIPADMLVVDDRTGYRFTGWYDADGNSYTFATIITASPLTLTAEWEQVIIPPTVYNVYFKLNVDDTTYYAQQEVEEGNKATRPADPTKAGYNFAGWVVYDNAGNAVPYNFDLPVTGELTIVASWDEIIVPPTPAMYKVYFKLNKDDITYYAQQDVEEGNKATRPADPTKTGYNFTGWVVYDNAGNATAYDFDTPVTGNLTIVATWEEITVPPTPTMYKVYFKLDADDTTYYAQQDVEEGNKATRPADPTKPGYTFAGWVVYNNSGIATTYDFDTPVTSNLTIVAIWDEVVVPPTVHNVYFKLNVDDTTYYAQQAVEEGNKATRPADPTKTGYNFTGWVVYDNAGNATAYDFDTPVTGELTIVATWEEITVPPTPAMYKVYFKLNKDDTTYYAQQDVEEGNKATKPADPTKTGYNFTGWVVYDNAGNATPYDFDAPVTGNLTIVATWEEIVVPSTTYKVTFKLNKDDTTYYAQQDVEEGNKATKPADPSMTGYVFVEWVVYDNAGNATAYDFDTPVTGNLTIVATWRLADTTVKYSIKFFVNAKDSILCEEVGTMSDIVEGSVIADDVVDAFYTDKGYPLADLAISSQVYETPVEAQLWYLDADGNWVQFTAETPVVNDMEVYAMVKFSSLEFNFADIGLELPINMLNLTVPYSTDRRLMHSFKDSMIFNRNKVANAMNQTGVQEKIYNKIATSTGLIDNEGYFIVKHYSFDIPNVISSLNYQGEIREYVRALVNGTEEDIKKLIKLSDVDVISGRSEQQIIDDIATRKAQDAANGDVALITEYVDYLYYNIMQRDGYDAFIDCYEKGQLNYTINMNNILYFMGAVEGVEKRDFVAALELMGNSSIISAVNALKSKFPTLFAELAASYNNANKKFCEDVTDICNKMLADSSYTEEYSLSLVMNINTAKLVELLYNDINVKLIEKLNNAPYYYNDNADLKQFVEMNIFEQIVYPYDASVADEVNTGYQLKSFMDYYDTLFNNLCLFDDAMTWYGTALSEEEFAQFKKDFADDLIAKLQSIRDIMGGLDEGGAIAGYTIDDIISKVETIKNSAADLAGGPVEEIINRICDILENTKEGRPVVKGYTIDDLADVCDKLANAVSKLSAQEYEALNTKLENAINKAVGKLDEIISELDSNGTVLGRPIDELFAKIGVINNFYSSNKDRINKIIDLIAGADYGQVEVDIKRWEDALFGVDVDDRYNIDDLFELLIPVIGSYKVADPTPIDGTIVIDEYTIGDDALGVTANRYFQ